MSDIVDAVFEGDEPEAPKAHATEPECTETSHTDERREVQSVVVTALGRQRFFVRVSSWRRVPEPWEPPSLSLSSDQSSSIFMSEEESMVVFNAVAECFLAFRSRWPS